MDYKQMLIKPEMCALAKKKVSIEKVNPETGEVVKIPFTIKAITTAQKDEAMNKAVVGDKGTNGVSFEQSRSEEHICLCGIVEPNFREQEWIDQANKNVIEYNNNLKKAIDTEFEEAMKDYNERTAKGEKLEKPKKRKGEYFPQIATANDLLRYVLGSGKINQLSEKILELSGFGTVIKDYVEEGKN